MYRRVALFHRRVLHPAETPGKKDRNVGVCTERPFFSSRTPRTMILFPSSAAESVPATFERNSSSQFQRSTLGLTIGLVEPRSGDITDV